jgi:hypothetical protein
MLMMHRGDRGIPLYRKEPIPRGLVSSNDLPYHPRPCIQGGELVGQTGDAPAEKVDQWQRI